MEQSSIFRPIFLQNGPPGQLEAAWRLGGQPLPPGKFQRRRSARRSQRQNNSLGLR